MILTSAFAQPATQSFKLDWQDNSTNEEGFFVYRDGAKVGQTTPNITSYTDTVTGAVNQQFCYAVSAFNHQKVDGTGNLQESAKSNVACGTIPVPSQTPPDAPSGLNTSALSSSRIQMSWSDNSDNETGFVALRRGEKPPRTIELKIAANTTEFTDTLLKRNSTYCYRLAAVNNGGRSAYSNESCATTRR